MRRRLLIFQALCFSLLVVQVGIAAKIRVQVDSLRDPQAPEKHTYYLHPGNQGVPPTDLQFKEFAEYVERALGQRGFVRVEQAPRAEIIIFLSYGIGPPQITAYSYPIFGQTGGGTRRVTVGSPTTGKIDTYTVSSPKKYGTVGTGTGTRVDYSRWVFLDAVDVEAYVKTGEAVQAWQTVIKSTGKSGDLRQVFPVLIAAAQPYIATNTEHQVTRALREKAPEVRAIKSGSTE